jgi:hypothetical protein
MTRRSEEADLQACVIAHLRFRAPKSALWFHVPNEGKRDPREGARLREMGMRAGTSDLVILHDSIFHALEIKTESGKATQPQRDFVADVKAAGGKAAIVYGLTAAIAQLEAWNLLNGRTQITAWSTAA